MFLDDRKMSILKAIIDDYIDTAEPIGSRTIARKHELGLSSATIRNEMADLEEMGYLAQPHTSAGRIPSDKGYRLYVDQLMKARELSSEEIDNIRRAMEVKINELNQLMKQASSVMSKITKYTSMAITPQMKTSILKAIQVVPIETGKALVIVVTNTGVVRNGLIKVADNISPDFLIKVSNILNNKLAGLTIEQINLPIIKEIEYEMGTYKEILIPILDSVADCITQIDELEVYLDGATNIFNYPEFRDVMKAREFLNVLDEKEILCRLLKSNNFNNKGITIQIGTENDLQEIKECSLVTTTYSLGDLIIGSIGIIGPTRMEYGRVISAMNYIREKINQEINRLVCGDLNDV
ncbi:MAG: heat-inducible transcriptional repressor HrcA [Clostridia bacterium]|nr:heat-inducible transcriptional repressor HrcA [Clostridia bacterium]